MEVLTDRSAGDLGPWVYAAVAASLLGEGQEECRASGPGVEGTRFSSERPHLID
jgi:hypothetical protein